MGKTLEIVDLHANVQGKEILKGVNLSISPGEVHAVMGPNGSGKSTLSNVIMGHPKYEVTSGDILFEGKSILNKTTDERSRLGVFLCFQYPTALPGVTLPNFLRNILKAHRGSDVPIKEFRKDLNTAMQTLQVNEQFLKRYVNDGFSGGEKKRNEILQMSLLKPKLAILDEVDSGLDIDALRTIAGNLESMRDPQRAMLVITHYKRLLDYLTVDKVHVFMDGAIRLTGERELADKLEVEGYDWVAKSIH